MFYAGRFYFLERSILRSSYQHMTEWLQLIDWETGNSDAKIPRKTPQVLASMGYSSLGHG
jgi:hypothetical protein